MANQASASTALAQDQRNSDPYANLAGTFAKANGLTARLRWAEDNAHLVAPATTCGRLPEGCAVALSIVHLDAKVDAHDVGFGKLGLLKHAVMKIAVAAGISFDPHSSGRLDDGSDAYYCHWKAIGAWRHLDGSVLPVVGDKEMDLRDGSAQVERIFTSASSREKGVKQLMEMRAFIVGHAQTKAELRAIRKALGLRSYTADELQKPFVIAKLMFTGQSDNPRIAEANAAAIRNSMLGGAQALFGPPAGSTVPTPQLPMANSAPISIGHTPPPVGTTRAELDDEGSSPRLGPHIDTTGTPVAETKSKAAAPATSSKKVTPPSSGVHVVKFGKQKGKPITELDDENLEWYSASLKKSVEDPDKARFRESNEADYQAALAEMERRNGVPPDPAANGGPANAVAKPAEASTAPAPAGQPTPPNFDEVDRGDRPEDY